MAAKRESASQRAARSRMAFARECRNTLRRAARRTPETAPDEHAAQLRQTLQRALAESAGDPLTMRAWRVVELLDRVDQYERTATP